MRTFAPILKMAAGLFIVAGVVMLARSQTIVNPAPDMPPVTLAGPSAPLNSQGRDGDAYVDTTLWRIYAPKAGGAWGSYLLIKPQTAIATTATDGTYTWAYPQAFSSPPSDCMGIAQATAGSTNMLNVQIDGAPTATQAKFKVTQTQLSVVALLGLTILSVPASSATVIHIECRQ
jgi:hypothetical protein